MNLSHARYVDVVVGAAVGRVDHASAEQLKLAIWPLLESCGEGREQLVLDCSQLEYISSAGLRVMMLAAREVKPRNGVIVVAALQPIVKEIFDISRFNLVFRVFADVRSALTELSPRAAAAFDSSKPQRR